jgi:hypothetical protein
MRSVVFIVGAVGLLFATTEAIARSPGSTATASATTTPSVAVQSYGIVPDWQPHAGTVNESWAYGRAAIISALGAFDLNSSIAATYWETARRSAIDNWAYQIRTKNQIHDEYLARELDKHRPPSPGQEQALLRQRNPKRLSSAQLSAAGVIRWPSALQTVEFDEARSRLASLFADRAQGPSASADEIMREVDAIAIEMKRTVEQGESDTPVMARVDAIKFLDGLRLEAHQRPDEAGSRVAAAAK